MQFKQKVSVQPQYAAWELVDTKTGLIVAQGEQHNLVLTQASELIAAHGLISLNNYAVVGTGSTAAAANQTGLVSEIARTNAVPSGEADTITQISAGVYDIRRVKQFTPAQVGNQNLREWGFSPLGTGVNNLAVRETFKNGGGADITITPTATQNLRIIHVNRITLLPNAGSNGSVNLGTLGNRTGRFFASGVYDGNFAIWSDLHTADALVRGAGAFAVLFARPTESYLTRYASGSAFYQSLHEKNVAGDVYVANSKQRTFNTNKAVYDQNSQVSNVYGFAALLSANNYLPFGYLFSLDVGQEFVKDNLHRLEMNQFTISWN